MKDSLLFSADSQHVGCIAQKGAKVCVSLDGRDGPEYDMIVHGSLTVSPDGQHSVCFARRGEAVFTLIDGHPGHDFDQIPLVVFSPDSKHVAYAAMDGKHIGVILDGQPGGPFDLICNGSPVFTPDGNLEYLAVRDGMLYRVQCRPVGKQ